MEGPALTATSSLDSPWGEPVVGRVLPGGIRVREVLGETPIGRHYRAEDPAGVELSVVVLGSSAELALRRPRLQPGIQIHHRNVVTIHDLNQTQDGLVYAVCERLTGEFLSVTLARRGALPQEEGLDLCRQAAAGLQAAHQLGWIYGSISPQNILLVPTVDGDPLVKLIGFPQKFPLQQQQAELPDEGRAYASPERIAGYTPDERSDVFSLGAVLHHVLTGAPPSPRSLSRRVPQSLRAVLTRALATSPAERFQTIGEFMAALGSSEAAVRPIVIEPVRPARKRTRMFWGAAALVGVVAGLWLLWGTQRLPVGASAGAESQESGSVAAVGSDSLARDPARAPAESQLVDVRSVDPTIQVDLRYATANNFTGAPLPGYEASRALLRPEVAAALGRVQARLRASGLGLRIFDAYRPLSATRAMADWARRTRRHDLLESGFIGQRSAHNLGVAVDAILVDSTGPPARDPGILVRAMKAEGFSTPAQPRWHFVYPLDGAAPLDRVIR